MNFWDHLEELRKVLLKSILVIAIGFVICLFFYEQLFTVIKAPLENEVVKPNEWIHHKVSNQGLSPKLIPVPTNAKKIHSSEINIQRENSGNFLLSPNEELEWLEQNASHLKLTLLSPTEGISTTFKLSLWVSLVATSPIWLFFLLGFAAPGLTRYEIRWVIPFLIISLSLIGAGLLFAFYVTLPLANHFLYQFNEKLAQNLWSLTSYVNYTLILLLGNALAFESFAILFILIHKGVIRSETLRKKRKVAFVLSFVVGAILTPPDVVTQCLLALPLFAFYELGYLYAKFKDSKRHSSL